MAYVEQQTNNTTAKVPQTPPAVATTFELAGEVHEALRLAAFNRRVPQKQIVDEALREYLKVPTN